MSDDFMWPEQDASLAPPRIPGKLVTWSEYGRPGDMIHGFVAWIGSISIGRVEGPSGGLFMCSWIVSLPSIDADTDVDGDVETVDEAKAEIEEFAKKWVAMSGLKFE